MRTETANEAWEREMRAARPENRLMTYTYDNVTVPHLAVLRDETRGLLGLWNVDQVTIERAVLVLTELYANVVTHVPGCRRCTVVLRLRDSVLEMRVRDDGGTVPPIPENPEATLLASLEDESGRGLCLVATYTDRFRFERVGRRNGTGKTAVVEWEVVA